MRFSRLPWSIKQLQEGGASEKKMGMCVCPLWIILTTHIDKCTLIRPPSACCGPPEKQGAQGRIVFLHYGRDKNQDRGLHNSWDGRAVSRERRHQQEEMHLWAICAALHGWAVRDQPVCVCGVCVCYWECGRRWRHPARCGTWTGSGSADHGPRANQVNNVKCLILYVFELTDHVLFLQYQKGFNFLPKACVEPKITYIDLFKV